MLLSYEKAYGVTREAPDETTKVSVLGKSHNDSTQYSPKELELFLPYHRLFKLGSKPAAHIEAMAKLSDDELLANMPASLGRLADAVIAKLESLPE
jgi:putative ATP-dependent endonuclease of OLD family